MEWLEITVNTTPKNIDKAATALTAGGFSDLVIEDQSEFETFLDQNRAYWDYIDESLQEKLQGLSCKKLGLSMTVNTMADTNWEESWKDNYPPQEVGKNLTVLPCWLAEDYTDSRIPVILDPGLTFGTGAHPSTQMVMEAMEENLRPGCACLDLGSGSGILSITALRLGAKSAIGVDIDPKAEDIARENAAYNGYAAPEFTALTGNVTEDTQMMETLSSGNYDMVLVNIVADVIIGLAPVLPRFLTEKSLLICSGILDTRLEDVTNALSAAGLTVTSVRAKEDWRCVTAKKE